MTRIPNVLSVAGSDPSGGAGIQADLKTFGALGCFGMAALTALTAQNTRGVGAIVTLAPDFVVAQIKAIFDDIRIDAMKIGMVATPQIAAGLGEVLGELRARYGDIPIVVDPVLASTSGHALGSAAVGEALVAHVMPHAALLTPNLGEAAALSGRPLATCVEDMRETGVALVARGARAVLVKGGHLDGGDAIDVLCIGDTYEVFTGRRIATRNTHGTGCTLSSAIAAHLARGASLACAIRDAKAYLEAALAAGASLDVGGGCGPVDHFHSLRRR